ncbi:MmgE/PrpD family protein [Achromobacter denitrificans]|uniref:MmgE/PrpD family protein n=1 Tax=Achromobacter denitrificans TaxID=32002 RepID=UPI0023E8AFAC|nr:MmgE/PrpD family protein [Achromobacter denitrificans]MDF3852347.1 MmgE/PrpD family protein [Achromobacter denitrificans]MDF3941200.1 MmgE/PrpD family protein [Achromobacter denitrificans]
MAESLPLAVVLGRFVAGVQAEHLPEEARQAVSLRLLDTLAAAASGVQQGAERGLLRLLPGDGPIAVWGTAARRGLRDAVIINSAVSHSAYFEDGCRYTGGHPSSALIPAAFALACERGSSGAELVAAIVAGYEVFLRLGRAIYPSTVQRGFQSTAILAAPATAAAASVLLRLPAERAAHAIAIACSHGAGLKEALKNAGSQPLQVGRSSEGGLLSALYAAQGADGVPDVIERGFFKAYAGTASADIVTRGLGLQWGIGNTYLKMHGGCRGNHAPVDAAAGLMREHGLAPRDIASMDVRVDTVTLAAEVAEPANADQAKFSIAFSIAAKLLKGDAMPRRYTDAALADPEMRALMARIRVCADAALDEGYPDRRGAMIGARTVDGRELDYALDRALGEPEQPYAQADIERKFDLTAGALYGPSAGRIKDMAMSLPALPGLTPLNDLLQASHS